MAPHRLAIICIGRVRFPLGLRPLPDNHADAGNRPFPVPLLEVPQLRS